MRLTDYRATVFFTGAGMSAESGVPTYRGQGGVWHEYDWSRCACQEAFERDPEFVWQFHDLRRERLARCAPNAGHERIARLERSGHAVTTITQNIDGLHQRAGSEAVVELHGSLWRTRCEQCGAREQSFEAPMRNIRCECGAYKRPDIVWFGDSLVEEVWASATDAVRSCELLIAVGTSAAVQPAAGLPLLAKRNGARLIEINLDETPTSSWYDECWRGPASELLQRIE